MALCVTVLIRLGDQRGRLAAAHVALPVAASWHVLVCPSVFAGHVVSRVCVSALLKNAPKWENATHLQDSLICTLGYASVGGQGVPTVEVNRSFYFQASTAFSGVRDVVSLEAVPGRSPEQGLPSGSSRVYPGSHQPILELLGGTLWLS